MSQLLSYYFIVHIVTKNKIIIPNFSEKFTDKTMIPNLQILCVFAVLFAPNYKEVLGRERQDTGKKKNNFCFSRKVNCKKTMPPPNCPRGSCMTPSDCARICNILWKN